MMLFCFWLIQPQTIHHSFAAGLSIQQDTLPKDTTDTDSIPPYTPSKTPTYEPAYRFGDPFSNRMSPSPLLLPDPSSIDLEVEMEDSTINYSVYERIGDANFRPVTNMSFEQYDAYDDQQSTKEYFQERSAGLDGESAVSGRSLIPRLYISPVFDRLFGGSYVDIQPNGFVNLDFGARFQRVDNPAIPRRQQRNGGFNFDQQISLNLVGKVGEKLAVTANFDNNNTFDFQNNMKVEYTGYEEDIVKKIEIGNVSMPTTNSLITGAQSLFGVKTQLQFGKLYLTGVASRQQGQTEVISVESGYQGKEFEVRASEYDENRHFFLGHFFRNNYEKWLRNLPQVTSGLNVTRVEVYVINRNNDTETTREVLGLMDLGEGSNIYRSNNPKVAPGLGSVPTDNEANSLYTSVAAIGRGSDQVVSTLENSFGFVNGTDFVKVGTARKLDTDEYEIHSKLGYISLLRQLSNDEMLAVAYEYTYNGQTYKVGELTEDYSGLSETQVVFLKMLRPNKINTDVPTWELMMKNIYSLNASQIEEDGFTLRIHYRDDASGIDNPSLHVGTNTKDKPLLQLLGLDQLNQNNDSQKDGNFDFVEGITIDSEDGYVIFPVLEPFGAKLESYFTSDEQTLKSKYVYNELYEETKADAAQEASKNKYYILGKMNAGTSSVISLSGINIAENSVVVTAGGTPLTEGLDYTVDYNLGTVRILNEGILNSGKTINISYEKSDVFNFQSRWLYGARADYQFNENFNIGATILRLSEQMGGVSRYTVGDEPTNNTKYGFDINFQEEAPFLTKAMDFLPLVSTKAPSSIAFNGEFAQILPGTSSIVDGEATAYIDDFENAATTININGWAGWSLAATPQTSDDLFLASASGLQSNYRKAKIAWYTVDQSVFYLSSGTTRPDNITEEDLENHYVRPVLPQEIYRERSTSVVLTPESLFDIAYYPSERGPYNYNPNVDSDGLLLDPKKNYGGITRAITNNVDFDNTNIEYLEFWLLDPFIEGARGEVNDGIFNTNNTTGGELVFNLGSVSEDVIPDGRHEFESGFPADGDPEDVVETEWGVAPEGTFLTNKFENTASSRENQDVGFDGLKDTDEQTHYASFITQTGVAGEALSKLQEDPSSDNFHYFLGSDLDSQDAKILERYKNYNGLDGNTPYSSNGTTRASTNTPDNEDLNSDNTLSELEEYYEYRVELPATEDLSTNKYVVDEITSTDGEATWYLFRIPIRDPDKVYGGISGYKSIKYIRMYLTNFEQPVVLRMSELQFVGSQWRKYEEALNDPGLDEIPETSYSDFDISVVNIEDNSTGSADISPYVLPPGISRDRDNTTVNNQQINEQSLQICVEDLEDKDARAVYKVVTYDLISYGTMKMFFHAEANNGDIVQDDEVTGFLRLGTDYTENYYEIEVPLKITPEGVNASDEGIRRTVWPEENELNFSITELLGVKSRRNREGFSESLPYSVSSEDGKYQFTVQGNPDLSSVQVLMVGVRNPESDDGASKSVCIWANELRVTDFNSTKGWAANARLSLQLADVATVSATASYSSIGFGSIQETASQRSREEVIQYDLSASVNVEKFLLPEKTGLKVPMFVSYEKSTETPQFDPLDPDIPLEASLQSIESKEERQEYKKLVQDRTERRSINFTNVHKEKVNPDAKDHFYDIENLSFSYAYSDVVSSNVNTASYLNRTVSGGMSYNYSPKPVALEPFAKTNLFNSPYLKLLKDINLSLLPSNVSFSAGLDRNLEYTQLYNDQLTTDGVDPYYERLFTFSRNYSFRWNLFKNLNIDYNSRAYAIIDEPEDIVEGEIDSYEERKYIWEEIKHLGRMKNFQQNISATYKTPLDKLPLTDWLSADLKYAAGYTWTAGSQVDESDSSDVFFGHTLQNNRQQGLSGKVDMVKLYNKVAFLKEINTPKRPKKGEEQKTGVGVGFLKVLMSLRTINVTYNINESTTLTGFKQRPFLFGMDSSWQAPGWKFLLGDQDPDIRFKAAENGWLIQSTELTSPFEQTYSTNFTIRAALEPAKDLKIQLDAQRSNAADYQEIFRFDSLSNDFASLTPSRSGSYNISFMSIKTAFDKRGADHSSKAFDQFLANVNEVRELQNALNPETGQYNQKSQDVLIPAFLAAYSGQSVSESRVSPFPKIPIPGWRIDYNGLTSIPSLADVFSSITLSHGYKSSYTVNDYNFNISNYADEIDDDFRVTLNRNILDYPQASVVNDSGEFVPVYIINQVTIADQFAPLIGINLRTKNNISTRLEYKKDRSLSLSMSNAQIAETRSNDVTMDFGYTKDKFKLPFKVKGRTITLENTLTMRISLTVRDTETVQRKLDGESVLTNGNTNFQLRPSMTYKLNDSLDLTMYFERSVTEPKVSSYKTATTAFGTQLRFNLAQ